MSSRRLTVRRTTYGVSEAEVLVLDYNDGSECPMFYIENGMIPFAVVDRIKYAVDSLGAKVDFDWGGRW